MPIFPRLVLNFVFHNKSAKLPRGTGYATCSRHDGKIVAPQEGLCQICRIRSHDGGQFVKKVQKKRPVRTVVARLLMIQGVVRPRVFVDHAYVSKDEGKIRMHVRETGECHSESKIGHRENVVRNVTQNVFVESLPHGSFEHRGHHLNLDSS